MDSIKTILKSAIKLAEDLESTAIIVSGDISLEGISTDVPIFFSSRRTKSIIDHLVTTRKNKEEKVKGIADRISQQATGKIDQIEVISATEYMLGELDEGLVVGIIETTDSIATIIHSLEDNQLVQSLKKCEERVHPEVMRTVLKIAFDISSTGREGKPIGTAFIIGDVEEVMSRSHQIILNPYSGHKDEDRDVLSKMNWESVKEFAQLDGVFIVSEEGKMESAGRYLDIDARDIRLDKGLGGRHVSAAAITRDTVAIAITVSESGGLIHVYMDGKELMSIESTERARCHNTADTPLE
ncbi:diadenylate cyclase [Methanolobus sp. ZRKC2]|uniref:DNA integrity scanning protein DisA nucleotide-binding domain protein n=1 Tax=Methanolobus sp. ZRKC2 TaxID=3125783 RepID=UPI00324605B3